MCQLPCRQALKRPSLILLDATRHSIKQHVGQGWRAIGVTPALSDTRQLAPSCLHEPLHPSNSTPLTQTDRRCGLCATASWRSEHARHDVKGPLRTKRRPLATWLEDFALCKGVAREPANVSAYFFAEAVLTQRLLLRRSRIYAVNEEVAPV